MTDAQKHAAAMIDSLGHNVALQLAEDHVALGEGVTYGVEYWQRVVAAIKRDYARGGRLSTDGE